MIYKIAFSCDESSRFRRVFEADSQATFLELHKAILDSVDYPDDQMTSFFMCNDNWEKEQEVTLVEMDKNFEYDNMTMEQTHLDDLLTERGQKLIYIFDPMFERCFFGTLKDMLPGHKVEVECVQAIGLAPKQIESEENLEKLLGTSGSDLDMDEDFSGGMLDLDELDSEGFQDLSFDDGTMF